VSSRDPGQHGKNYSQKQIGKIEGRKGIGREEREAKTGHLN
jgi:hypothetical protein